MVDLVTTKREQILRLARRHGVTGVRVFGSMARGDARPQSDVDLLSRWGVIRNLQTLAESSQLLSEAVKASQPPVDWKGPTWALTSSSCTGPSTKTFPS